MERQNQQNSSHIQHQLPGTVELYTSTTTPPSVIQPVYLIPDLKDKDSRDLQGMVVSQIYCQDLIPDQSDVVLTSNSSNSVSNMAESGSASEYTFIQSLDNSLSNVTGIGHLTLPNIFHASESDSEVALTLASLGDPKNDKIDHTYIQQPEASMLTKSYDVIYGNASSICPSGQAPILSTCPDDTTVIRVADSANISSFQSPTLARTHNPIATSVKNVEVIPTLVLRSRKGRGNINVSQQYHNFPDPERIGKKKRKRDVKSKCLNINDGHSVCNTNMNLIENLDIQFPGNAKGRLDSTIESHSISKEKPIEERSITTFHDLVKYSFEENMLKQKPAGQLENTQTKLLQQMASTMATEGSTQSCHTKGDHTINTEIYTSLSKGEVYSLHSSNMNHSTTSPHYIATPTNHSATPTNHSATPTHNSATPTHHSATPTHHSATPTHNSATPTHHSATPIHHSATPTHHSATPTQHSATPTHHSATPTHHSATPTHHSATTTHHSATTIHQIATPTHHSATPTQHSATPTHHSATPTHHSATPTHHSATPNHSTTPTHHSATPPIHHSAKDTYHITMVAHSIDKSKHNNTPTTTPTYAGPPAYENFTTTQRSDAPTLHDDNLTCTKSTPSHYNTALTDSDVPLIFHSNNSTYLETTTHNTVTLSNNSTIYTPQYTTANTTVTHTINYSSGTGDCNIIPDDRSAPIHFEESSALANSLSDTQFNGHINSSNGIYYTICTSEGSGHKSFTPSHQQDASTGSAPMTITCQASMQQQQQQQPDKQVTISMLTAPTSYRVTFTPVTTSTSLKSESATFDVISNKPSTASNDYIGNNINSIDHVANNRIMNSKNYTSGSVASSSILLQPIATASEKENLLGQLLKASEHCEPASLIPAGVVNDVIPAVGYRIVEVTNLSEMIRSMHVCSSSNPLGSIVIQEQASLREGAVSQLSIICTACQEGTVCATSNRAVLGCGSPPQLASTPPPWDINLRVQQLVEEFGITEDQIQRLLEILGIFYRPSESSISPPSPLCSPSHATISHTTTTAALDTSADDAGEDTEQLDHAPVIKFEHITDQGTDPAPCDASQPPPTQPTAAGKRKRRSKASGPQLPKSKTLSCPQCSAKFVALNHLKKHMHSHNLSQHTCPYCQAYFKKPYNLKEHIKKHQNIKYQCDACSREFTDRSSLIVHKKSAHEMKYEFRCAQCPKIFYRRIHFMEHMRLHTREAPFGCEICGRHFIWRGSVKKHMDTHIAEAKYNCNLCGKWFRWLQGIRQHLQQQHKVKKCDVEAQVRTNGAATLYQKHLQTTQLAQKQLHFIQQPEKQQLQVEVQVVQPQQGNDGQQVVTNMHEDNLLEPAVVDTLHTDCHKNNVIRYR